MSKKIEYILQKNVKQRKRINHRPIYIRTTGQWPGPLLLGPEANLENKLPIAEGLKLES